MANYTVTPANVKKSSGRDSGLRIIMWGEAVNAGDAVRLGVDGKWYLIDANDTSGSNENQPTKNSDIAIAMTSGEADQVGVIAAADGMEIDYGAGVFTTSDTVIADGVTPGDIKPVGDLATNDFLIRLGYAKTDALLVIDREVTGVQKP